MQHREWILYNAGLRRLWLGFRHRRTWGGGMVTIIWVGVAFTFCLGGGFGRWVGLVRVVGWAGLGVFVGGWLWAGVGWASALVMFGGLRLGGAGFGGTSGFAGWWLLERWQYRNWSTAGQGCAPVCSRYGMLESGCGRCGFLLGGA